MIEFQWLVDADVFDGCIVVMILNFNVVDGSSMKIWWNEAFMCIVVYQEHLAWKFMKRGPWKILRVGAFSEEDKYSCQ